MNLTNKKRSVLQIKILVCIYLSVGCERCNCDPGSAVQLVPGRGRALSGSALYSEALLYSLLGLCIIVLMFTLTAAVLLLLQRAKQQQHLDTTKQQLNKDGQSSKGASYSATLWGIAKHIQQRSKNIQCFWFNFCFIYHFILWQC